MKMWRGKQSQWTTNHCKRVDEILTCHMVLNSDTQHI